MNLFGFTVHESWQDGQLQNGKSHQARQAENNNHNQGI
jgi:hypothetical protein